MPPTIEAYEKSLASSDEVIASSIVADWDNYCAMQDQLEREFFGQNDDGMFRARTMSCLLNSGEFSCDNTVQNLCSNVWKIDAIEVP